jgi:hypothetical protein
MLPQMYRILTTDDHLVVQIRVMSQTRKTDREVFLRFQVLLELGE